MLKASSAESLVRSVGHCEPTIMKRLLASFLVVSVCAILSGCSSLQPSPEQRAAADRSPWNGGAPPAAPDDSGAGFVAGLLNTFIRH